ncbi:hypothetical protein [Virgisporangium aliadipatigenens]|uniref:hypothetical protein n=1 Tax=Virgisporangium aliadipatigenens TaxID=741659 RepID=UPI00194407E8|nr:hypothetical protein [Virgisporangium aliadipatigenens]
MATVLTALAVAVGVGGGTALAAPDPAGGAVRLAAAPEILLAVNGFPRTVRFQFTVGDAKNAKATFELAKAADVATFGFPAACVTTGTAVTCALGSPAQVDVVVRPKAGVAAGAKGSIAVTTTADGVQPHTQEIPVSVHAGVDLTLQEFPAAKEYTPDQKFTIAPVVANYGGVTAKRIQVVYSYALGVVPSNYASCQNDADARRFTCTYDQSIPAHNTWGLPALEFGFSEDAFGSKPVSVTVVALEAVAAAEPVVSAQGTDINVDDNTAIFGTTVKNTYDIAANGANASGAKDASVEVTIGVKNNGKATLDGSATGASPFAYTFAVPPGTQVTGVPAGCSSYVEKSGGGVDIKPGAAGGTFYGCVTDSVWFKAGSTDSKKFTLKITEVKADATGTVSFHNPFAEIKDPPADKDTANDTAKVVINPSSTSGNNGGTTTSNGSLPITGTSTNVPMLVWTGGMMLMAGFMLVLLGRKPEKTEEVQTPA